MAAENVACTAESLRTAALPTFECVHFCGLLHFSLSLSLSRLPPLPSVAERVRPRRAPRVVCGHMTWLSYKLSSSMCTPRAHEGALHALCYSVGRSHYMHHTRRVTLVCCTDTRVSVVDLNTIMNATIAYAIVSIS